MNQEVKDDVLQGIIGAHVVLADRLHQAVQEASKGQEEKRIQPEETTTSQDTANVCS